jgi:drug/metabolite transporter (DMT)-like permease
MTIRYHGEPMTGLQFGELAAVGTAVLWTLSTLAWTSSGRRIGALAVSFHRLMIASVFLALYGGLVRGQALPTDADHRTWLILGLSGLLGFFVCDLCAFKALLMIGPRLTLLLQALSPPTAALLSWMVMGEMLVLRQWLAMGVTLSGITWVVLERQVGTSVVRGRHPSATGVLLAIMAALTQAIAMMLSRQGIGQYDAVAATFIRVLAAIPGYAVLLTVIGHWPAVFIALRDVRAMTIVIAGSMVGPFLGVVACMIALRHAPTGVVVTIINTMPVLILPFAILLYRERVSPRAAAGAIVTVAGVGLMCWGT